MPFVTQLKVVNRERAAGLYDALPFYAAAFFVNLPLELAPQVGCGAIIYFMTNLRAGVSHFITFVIIMALENFTGIALGMVLSAWLKSVDVVPKVAPLFVVLFLMFSGYLINDASVPVWLIWLKDISFIRYAFTALAINEFKGAQFTCLPDGGPCLDGDDTLQRLNFGNTSIARQIVYIAIELVVFNVLAFAILVYRKPRHLQLRPGAKTHQPEEN